MRIIVDGMGGDNAPGEIVKGCLQAAALAPHEIVIVGDETAVRKELDKHSGGGSISVIHASQTIENDEAPVKAVRTKKDSSIVKGLNMVKEKEADLFISAGNSGAIMAGSMFILGRIPGIDRPAIAATFPILSRGAALLADSGANTDCKPRNLLEFATMGSIYAEKVLELPSPRVGLINVGVEASKGPALQKAAYELLELSPSLNFIGNVEAREVPQGCCDVAVCDGFTGNVFLKTMEGMGSAVMRTVKHSLTSDAFSKMGAFLLMGKLRKMKALFDYAEYGGAPILGVRGAVVKMHGSSDARAVKCAILKGIPYAENKVVQMIEDSVLEMEALERSE
ncbi:MAG: phosphate acyltransferase PlsX [Bacillota bacterium]|nr:phosphate acyltransferase PlsX [Bacillota bacterium]